MSLQDEPQQNIQLELDFSSTPTGEARQARREETESSGATSGPESPASTNRLMNDFLMARARKQRRSPKRGPSAGTEGTGNGFTSRSSATWLRIGTLTGWP